MVIGMLGKLQPWHLVCWALLRTSLSLIWNTRKCSFGLVSTQVNITTPSYLKTNKHKPLMVANFESCIMWRNFFSTLLHFPLVIKLESFREILLSKFILLFHSIYQLYFYVYTRFYLYLFNHYKVINKAMCNFYAQWTVRHVPLAFYKVFLHERLKSWEETNWVYIKFHFQVITDQFLAFSFPMALFSKRLLFAWVSFQECR